MKWYNKENTRIYKEDLQYSPIEDDLVAEMLRWVPTIAGSFNREYPSIGILDMNDLIQAGNLHLIQAIKALDWDRINAAHEDERRAMIWSYIKRRVKNGIRKEIDYYKDSMRTHRSDGSKRSNAPLDNHLTMLFPDFFEGDYAHIIDEESDSSWDIEQLAMGLDRAMREILSDKERMILEASYGIDCEKVSIKELANVWKMSEIGIKKSKQRAIDKLKNNELTEKYIQIYYTY